MRKVVVVPVTVQTLVVCEANVTVRPEVDVAESVSGVPTVCVPGLLNVIVCDCNTAFTVKLRATGVAAAQAALPPCEAWIVHVPAMRKVAVVPLTVQTLVVCDANVTASPEVAVAVRVKGVPTVCVAGVLKVIVCGCPLTVKLWDTGVAAAQVVLPAWDA
jgi:hypothetical protein